MCVYTRESAFSWCLKKSSMMIDDRTGSLLDELSSRLSFEAPFHSLQEQRSLRHYCPEAELL